MWPKFNQPLPWLLSIIALAPPSLLAQPNQDSIKWSVHFQLTVIAQIHAGFKSLYRGINSLADSVEPVANSVTSTIFFGRKLWKGAALYVNPEISGGKGLSFTKGVAGALNGETYRVGEVSPQPFIARAYLQQNIRLGNSAYIKVGDDVNQVAAQVPVNRITLSAGKFSVSDFFDDNRYSKDPRTQFFNWSIWANGAWDYPANTRGYTYGIVAEWIKPKWAARLSTVTVPRIANFHLMEYNISKAHSETAEIDHEFLIRNKTGNVRLILSNTYSRAPSYSAGLKALPTHDTSLLDVISGNAANPSYGGKKFGVGLNIDQDLTNAIGVFSRLGWNDGKYVSWAFTEIDQTLSAGLSIKGSGWQRPNDVLALCGVINGISKMHQNFLAAGGYGFIIGDGKLNYGHELIFEGYYDFRLAAFISLSLDYQFVNNPGYNMDRGPVHVFGVRVHVER